MVQDATSDGIPQRGAYAVRDPQVGDSLAMPLRAAFRKESKMPCEIEACLDQLRQVRFRG